MFDVENMEVMTQPLFLDIFLQQKKSNSNNKSNRTESVYKKRSFVWFDVSVKDFFDPKSDKLDIEYASVLNT